MIYVPFLGALALGVGTVLEKLTLRKKKLDIQLYQTALFLAIVIVMLPLLLFFWKIDSGAFLFRNVIIFLLTIIVAVFANSLVFYSLKQEKISNLQPARNLEPIFTILLSFIVSLLIKEASEMNLKFLIPAVIASIAVIFPHVKKGEIQFNKYFIAAIAGSFLYALELILSKLILEFYSPITFYFLRCLFIFIFSLAVFRPDFKPINKRLSLRILGIAAIWVVYRVAVYFGYMHYGIVFTTLITLMAPVLIYFLAGTVLKEKLNWKNILSSIIVVGCVIYSILF